MSKLKFIRLKEVMACTGLARATIYKYMSEDSFPKTISLGDRAVAWIESEVVEWMLAKIERRSAEQLVICPCCQQAQIESSVEQL